MSGLTATSLAGSGAANGRVQYDYYATNPTDTVNMIRCLHRDGIVFEGTKFLEPCAGGGHIVEVCKASEYMPMDQDWYTMDIMDRGYPLTCCDDFLIHNFTEKFDNIITNPPYAIASSFAEKCISLLNDNGKLVMFLKLQFLETLDRKELFDLHPPKYVYVMRYRAQPWANGLPYNPVNGKEWASPMAFAWFVWVNGSTTEPIIRWVDDSDRQSTNKRLF